jgi:inositol phosphorylceramide mannosyltransferase catalytic subunit
MIPRIIHQIWLGRAPVPHEFTTFSEGWRRLHPDWEYILWTDNGLPEIINEHVFEAVSSMAGKADVLRYELVWRYGGIYVDMDFECLRPIDVLLEEVPAFIADQRVNRPINGLFGAERGHGLTAALIAALPESFATRRGLFDQTGPGFLRRVFYQYLGADFTVEKRRHGYLHQSRDSHRVVQGFERDVFCPYDSHEKHRRHERFPSAYAVHHWAGSWMRPGV